MRGGPRGVGGSQAQLQRLLSLVPYVLARPGVPTAEVAAHFGVKEAQVLRDLNVLWYCGLPGLLPGDLIEVDMDAAEGGTVHVTNADPIARPLRLQVDEALALLVALRALAEMPGVEDRDAVARALAKIEKAAGDAATEAVPVAVEVPENTQTDTAKTVRAALAAGRRVHLSYYVPHRDETTERDVEPMRMVIDGQAAYLEGWCRRAEGVRLFRLDRISGIDVLDEPADVPAEARSRDMADSLFHPAPDDMLITLELSPSARWVIETYPLESVEELPGGRALVRLRTADSRWIVRLALRLGGSATVLDPPEVAGEVRAVAEAALAAYAPPRAPEGIAARTG